MALSWTLDKLGPMCRSAEDCRIVFDAIAGRDSLDASSKERPAKSAAKDKKARIKIGVLKDSYEKAQPEVRDNFLQSIELLKSFADVQMEIKLPDFPYGPAVGTIVDAEGASAFRDLIESGEVKKLASPSGQIGGYSASLVTAVDYIHAMRLRAPMRRAWAKMFEEIDLLVAPSRATVAYPIDRTFDKAYPGISTASPIGASNLVGVPAISIPNGFGQNNLPTGIQFVAGAWNEDLLFEAANKLQQAADWHKRRPNLT
jgi:aspartyl-tRNA(Asn)/glutamyl-tRNA(Gln) amidotransferase subunit A